MVGDEPEILQHLRLLRVALGPLPLLHDLLVEGVAVDVALAIASGAGIPVPVPRPPDVVGLLDHLHRQPQLVAQAMELIQPGEARSHDDGIVIRVGRDFADRL
jgi:hypothetical protein